jgi:hypothetical protein
LEELKLFGDFYKNYFCKYFPATERANDGRIINTQVNKSLNRSGFGPTSSGTFGPKFPLRTIVRPTNPKQIEEIIKTFVAIFCMYYLLHC